MLAIQDITLTWSKSERGGLCAETRACFPRAYMEKAISLQGEAVVFRRGFFQRGGEIVDAAQNLRCCALNREELEKRIRLIEKRRVRSFESLAGADLACLSLRFKGSSYDAGFFYDERRCGAPVRRGANRDYNNPSSPLFGKDFLNERAFLLSYGRYGRMIWNERLCDADTGEWYYRLRIYNLIHVESRIFAGTEFISKEPDFIYERLEHLY